MANPQHLEWLLEGVEAWNARREREPFTPDLSGAKLGGTNLEEASLRAANLREANLTGAHLEEANLTGAHLEEANLRGTDLGEAKLSGARLWNAKLWAAKLWGANAKSVLSISNDGSADFTDLSVTTALTQAQLDSMDDDSHTIIPAHLIRPAHWPIFDPETGEHIYPEETEAPETAQPRRPASPQLIAQTRFLLSIAPASAQVAAHTAKQLRQALAEMPHDPSRNEASEDERLVLAIAQAFETLSAAFASADQSSAARDTEIARLAGELAASKAEIERLNALLAKALQKPSAVQHILIGAAGNVLGTGIIAAFGYFFGPEAAPLIQLLHGIPAPRGPTRIA